MMKQKFFSIFFYLLLGIYTFLLCYVLFLGRGDGFRTINLVPFQSIIPYITGSLNVSTTVRFLNVFGNILIFFPLGIYISLFRFDKNMLSNTLFIAGISLTAEIIQYVLAIGASDIDDIILNTLGGFLGILLFSLIKKFTHTKERSKNIISILSASAGLPVFTLFIVVTLYNL